MIHALICQPLYEVWIELDQLHLQNSLLHRILIIIWYCKIWTLLIISILHNRLVICFCHQIIVYSNKKNYTIINYKLYFIGCLPHTFRTLFHKHSWWKVYINNSNMICLQNNRCFINDLYHFEPFIY